MSSRVTRPLLSSEVKNRPRSYPPLFIGERVKQRRTFLTFLPLAFVPWELCVCECVVSFFFSLVCVWEKLCVCVLVSVCVWVWLVVDLVF